MRVSGETDFNVTAALLALALAIGGAGLAFPMLQLLLGLSAVAAGAYFAVTERSWRFHGNRRLALWLLAIALLLPLLQLIPLPPALWHAIPGREVPIEIDTLLGWNDWRPLTLDVEGTVRSFLVMLPAAMVFVGCLFLSSDKLERLLWVVLGVALVSSALGLVQLATGGQATPYPSGHLGYPLGLFVNRNHHGSLLLVAMPIAAALGAIRLARGKPRLPTIVMTLSLLIVFALVVVGTTSRMGLALLPVAVIAALFILFRGRVAWRLALPSIFGLAGVALIIFASGRASLTLARFSAVDDLRFGYWTDIQWTLDRYTLAGSGFGTFVPIYQAAESLEGLGPAVVNHAHNDFLEILLEGGVVGIGLLLVFLALLAMAAFKLARANLSVERGLMATAAASGIVILLLSSFVDYPLRMPVLGAVFALLCALLLPRRADQPKRSGHSDSRALANVDPRGGGRVTAIRVAAMAMLLLLALLIVQAGVSSQSIQSGQYRKAANWAPWSTRAHERASTEALAAGQTVVALSEAQAALGLSPISAGAVRSIGVIELLRGQSARGNALMNIAAGLGWHDPIVQLWVIDRALRSGDTTTAVQRAEGLFRQNQFPPAALTLLLRAPKPEPALAALSAALAQQPPWRSKFLAMGAQVEAAEAPAFERLLARLAANKPGLSTSDSQPFVDRLIGLGDVAAARRVWTMSRGNRLLVNGGFETNASSRTGQLMPDAWSLISGGRSRPIIGRAPPGGQGNALRIIGGNGGKPVVVQRLLLAPGAYSLTFRAYAKAPLAASLRWEIQCARTRSAGADAILSRTSGWRDFKVDLSVPLQDCPIQRLALRTLGDIQANEIWIDDVRLQPQSTSASAR